MKLTLRLLLLSLLFVGFGVNAQVSFFEDFDSYSAGDNITDVSEQFVLWPGTLEGSQVSNELAFSGDNALLVTGVAGGGPSDILLDFGDTYNDGLFTFSMLMHIPEGNSAYQNIQAVSPAGTTWAMDIFFNGDGSCVINQGSNAEGFSFSSIYPQGEWFAFTVEVNLSTNIWQLFVGDKLLGFFENANNSVASLNLYPFSSDGSTPLVYIDDIRYDWQEYDLPDLDVAIIPTSLKEVYLTSDVFELSTNVKNVGLDNVNEVTINYSLGDQSYSETLEGLDLGFTDQFTFTPSNQLVLEGGINDLIIEVVNPNGTEDDQELNNRQELTLFAYEVKEHKKVLVEEFTGTWCQACPSGAIAMDALVADYGEHVVPVAIHDGIASYPDPMESLDILPTEDPSDPQLSYVDALIAATPGFTGYPNITIDRGEVDLPARLYEMTLPRLGDAPDGYMEIAGQWNTDSGDLRVDVTANDIGGMLTTDHRLAVIITEDDVTGTTSGYAQVNGYSGLNVNAGGYEDLPNPVPASQMVYEFVARAYLGHFNGTPGSISSTTEPTTFSFFYNLPEEWNKDHMKVNAILMDADGNINNALDAVFWDAIEPTTEDVASGIDSPNATIAATVYPNPFSSMTNITLTNESNSDIEVIVYNVMGVEVARRTYQGFQGQVTLPMNASGLANGHYVVEIVTQDGISRKHISLQR